MERLTHRHPNGEIRVTTTKFNSDEAMQIALARLAELEDKLESGELVELPFAIGDKVYLVRRNRNWEWAISRTTIEMYLKHQMLLVKCACSSEWQDPKNIFSDRKQAQAKLDELKKENGK